LNRREFVRRLVVSSVFTAVAVTGLVELSSMIRRNEASQQASEVQTSPTATTEASAPQGYLYLTTLGALGTQPFIYFEHPTYGNSILLNFEGQWKAFSAICTHEVCTIQFPGKTLYCPCHGATFDASNGAVLSGPPPRPLPEYQVQIQKNEVYVSAQAL
jgi:Rieske Fe-S protein